MLHTLLSQLQNSKSKWFTNCHVRCQKPRTSFICKRVLDPNGVFDCTCMFTRMFAQRCNYRGCVHCNSPGHTKRHLRNGAPPVCGHHVRRMRITIETEQKRCNDASLPRSLSGCAFPQKACMASSTDNAPSMRHGQQKMVCRIQGTAAAVDGCKTPLHLRPLFAHGLAQTACTHSWNAKAHRLKNG